MANQSTWVKNLDGTSYDIGVCPNTCKIVYPASSALADLMDTVETWITAHGWAVYDASAGTNARAYRAANVDGSTYKYVVLDWNTSNNLNLKVYESWNSGTHTGTNQTNVAGNATVALTAGSTLFVAAKSTHLFVCNVVAGALNGNNGCCFEWLRDNPDDTVAAGYPCFGSWSGTSQSSSWYAPKIKYSDSTGVNASLSVGTSYGIAISTTLTNNNPWTNKQVVQGLVIFANVSNTSEYKGRIPWLKYAAFGNLFDEMTIKVDANGIVDSTGTSTVHVSVGTRFVLPK